MQGILDNIAQLKGNDKYQAIKNLVKDSQILWQESKLNKDNHYILQHFISLGSQ